MSVTPDYQILRIRRPGEPEPVAELVVYQPGAAVDVGGGGTLVLREEYTAGGYLEIVSAAEPPLTEPAARQLVGAIQFTAPYQIRAPSPARPPAGRSDPVQRRAGHHRAGSLPVDDPARAPRLVHSADLRHHGRRRLVRSDDPGWDWQPTTVADRPAECVDLIDGRRCRVELDEFTVSIGSGGLDPDELDRLVAGLHPAAWGRPIHLVRDRRRAPDR